MTPLMVLVLLSSAVNAQDSEQPDLLFKPHFTLDSSEGGVTHAGQQEHEVSQGVGFSITCSVQPQYPGGDFRLVFTGPNRTAALTMPAVNHSARFLFPAANDSHQGTYGCVYHVRVFDHDLSSVSDDHILAVKSSKLLGVATRMLLLVALALVGFSTACYFHIKAARKKAAGRANSRHSYYNLQLDAEEERPRKGGELEERRTSAEDPSARRP